MVKDYEVLYEEYSRLEQNMSEMIREQTKISEELRKVCPNKILEGYHISQKRN